MEELKFLSAAVLALILAVSCQNEYDAEICLQCVWL